MGELVLNKWSRVYDIEDFEMAILEAELDAPRLCSEVVGVGANRSIVERPYLIDYGISPSQIREMFHVDKPSKFVATIMIFRTKEDRELYIKQKLSSDENLKSKTG